MANIPILKQRETETIPFLSEMEDLFERIRRRAYGLFERRGRGDGGDLGDWFTAEREMLWSPPAELMEKDGAYQARIAAPGFDAKEIQVSATPRCIVVRAEATKTGEKEEGNLHFSDFGERALFRRIDLSERIDPGKVKAILDKGILELTAEKAAKPKTKNITAAA
jgi:HSP20 family protein